MSIPIKGVKYRSSDKHLGVAKVPIKEPEGSKPSMSSFRRKYLEGIRNKEETRIRKEKVGKILMRKLAIKFGSQYKKLIKPLVLEMLEKNDKLSASLIGTLEASIIDAIKRHNDVPKSSTANIANPETEEQNNKTSRVKIPPVGTEWEILNAYQSIVNEERERRDKEMAAVRKLKFKETLDKQIQEAKGLKAQLDIGDKKYSEYVSKDVQVFTEQQKAKQAEERAKHVHELKVRQEQINEQMRFKEEERRRARKEEEDTIKFANEKLIIEKEKLLEKKKAQQAVRTQIEMSNEANKERHRQAKLLEVEEERRMMKEYEAKLDREAYERDNAFKKRMETMDAIGHIFQTGGAGKAAREEQLRIELFLLNEAKKKEAADAAAAAAKEEERRKREEKVHQDNERLLEWRKRMEEMEKQEEGEISKKYKDDVRAFQEEENMRWMKKREKQMQYRLQLRSQEESKRSRPTGNPMEPREREMNMEVLVKALDEVPDILEKIPRRRPQTTNDAYR